MVLLFVALWPSSPFLAVIDPNSFGLVLELSNINGESKSFIRILNSEHKSDKDIKMSVTI